MIQYEQLKRVVTLIPPDALSYTYFLIKESQTVSAQKLPDFIFCASRKKSLQMQYNEYHPDGLLGEYVQTIWAMESENDEEIYPRSLIMHCY